MALLKEEHNVEARLMDTFSQIVEVKNRNLLQENANVDGQSLMEKMGKFASESGKFYAMEKLLHPSVKRAIEENYIHPHDFDFYPTGTTTCCQIPLGELLKNGFNTGHGHMREPSSITSALALASIIFQANQNMQHGVQSFPMFDFDLAPYVRKTYIHGDENSIRRGNLSFTSINHVKIALTTKTVEKFMEKLHNYIDIAILQLLERFRFQVVHHHFHNQDMHCQLCLNNHKLYNGQRDD